MSEEIYGLNADDREALRELLRAFREGRLNPVAAPTPADLGTPVDIRLAVVTDGLLPGIDPLTLKAGKGTAKPYDLAISNGLLPGDFDYTISDPLAPPALPLRGKEAVVNVAGGAIAEGETVLLIRDVSSGAQMALPFPGDDAQTEWVRVLCPVAGAYGYPGLVQSYDSASQTFSDEDGGSTTVSANIATGLQTVAPASMTGIVAGAKLMVIDSFCQSEVVEVVSVSSANFTAVFANTNVWNGVKSITITNAGSGYAGGGVAPTISFTGGGGSGAAATAVLTGDTVTSVNITSHGSGYASAPTVVVSNSGTTGTGFAGTANLSGDIILYLSAVWVGFDPLSFVPAQADVDAPTIYLARHEEDAPDGVPVYVALDTEGATVDGTTDYSSFGTETILGSVAGVVRLSADRNAGLTIQPDVDPSVHNHAILSMLPAGGVDVDNTSFTFASPGDATATTGVMTWNNQYINGIKNFIDGFIVGGIKGTNAAGDWFTTNQPFAYAYYVAGSQTLNIEIWVTTGAPDATFNFLNTGVIQINSTDTVLTDAYTWTSDGSAGGASYTYPQLIAWLKANVGLP